jgi:uncharacterized protein (TIGR02118 family)
MYKIIFAITFKGPDKQRSREHWATTHVDLVRAVPGLVKLIHNEKLVDLRGERFDGIAELYFEDEAAYEKALDTDSWNKVKQDGENFLDWDGSGGGIVKEYERF